MKKYLLVVVLLVGFFVDAFAQSRYFDKTAEAMFKPLRNCNYVVDFEFYERPVRVVGYKDPLRRKLPSTMPKVVVNKIVLTKQDHYDGYHKEEHYKYFLVQVPSKGYMKLNYTFTDRMGNIYIKSEKIFTPKYRQIFPSNSLIPRKCNGRKFGLR